MIGILYQVQLYHMPRTLLWAYCGLIYVETVTQILIILTNVYAEMTPIFPSKNEPNEQRQVHAGFMCITA